MFFSVLFGLCVSICVWVYMQRSEKGASDHLIPWYSVFPWSLSSFVLAILAAPKPWWSFPLVLASQENNLQDCRPTSHSRNHTSKKPQQQGSRLQHHASRFRATLAGTHWHLGSIDYCCLSVGHITNMPSGSGIQNTLRTYVNEDTEHGPSGLGRGRFSAEPWKQAGDVRL